MQSIFLSKHAMLGKKPTATTGGTRFPYVFLKPLQSPTKMRDQQPCVKRSPRVVEKLPISSWNHHSKEPSGATKSIKQKTCAKEIE
jgi:hypothetical protein